MIVSILLPFFLSPPSSLMSILWSLAAVGIITIFVFVWHLLIAPWRIHNQQRLEITEKDRQIAKLKQQKEAIDAGRDLSLQDACEYLSLEAGFGQDRPQCDIEHELRQGALDGKITVWACLGDSSYYQKIPSDHFKTYAIYLDFATGGKIYHQDGWLAEGVVYHDIMFSRKEIEKCWPKKS